MRTSRRSCVPDTSVLIDFDGVGLLDNFLSLPYRWVLPDLVLQEELISPSSDVLLALGIAESSFDGNEIQTIGKLCNRYASLSPADCAMLFLAKRENAILMTGDKVLRKVAASYHVEVHGSIWGLDEMVRAHLITPKVAINALNGMRVNNGRLPQLECEQYIEKWKGECPSQV